ncbi:uncharacterized protein EDB93DRAFT_1091123, partial [Suillus bovinus]|uniref:uncharacterized protein n=1 Tax=Suillus bovinus TaxID=48563 RepID=UPI001B8699BE
YPNLHRMALVFLVGHAPLLSLASQLMSTSSNISQGWHLLCFTRNRLSPSSTRAFLCLGSWLHCGLVAPEDLTKISEEEKTSVG